MNSEERRHAKHKRQRRSVTFSAWDALRILGPSGIVVYSLVFDTDHGGRTFPFNAEGRMIAFQNADLATTAMEQLQFRHPAVVSLTAASWKIFGARVYGFNPSHYAASPAFVKLVTNASELSEHVMLPQPKVAQSLWSALHYAHPASMPVFTILRNGMPVRTKGLDTDGYDDQLIVFANQSIAERALPSLGDRRGAVHETIVAVHTQTVRVNALFPVADDASIYETTRIAHSEEDLEGLTFTF